MVSTPSSPEPVASTINSPSAVQHRATQAYRTSSHGSVSDGSPHLSPMLEASLGSPRLVGTDAQPRATPISLITHRTHSADFVAATLSQPEIPPETRPVKRKKSQRLEDRKRTELETFYVKTISAQNPNYYAEAKTHYQKRELIEAVQVANLALELSSLKEDESIHMYEIIAKAKFQYGDYDGAFQAAQKILKLEPQNIEAYAICIEVLMALKDFARGKIYLDQTINLCIHLQYTTRLIPFYLKRINFNLQNKEFVELFADTNQTTNKIPLQRYAEALADIEQAIALDPKPAFFYEKLAEIKIHFQDFHAALAAAEKAIELNPNKQQTFNAQLLRMQASEMLEDQLSLISSTEEILKLDPNNMDAIQARIRLLDSIDNKISAATASKNYPLVLQLLELSVKIEGCTPTYLWRRSIIKCNMLELASAMADLELAISQTADNEANKPFLIRLHLSRLNIVLNQNNYSAADTILQAIMQLDPKNHSYYKDFITGLIRSKQQELAMVYLDKLVALDNQRLIELEIRDESLIENATHQNAVYPFAIAIGNPVNMRSLTGMRVVNITIRQTHLKLILPGTFAEFELLEQERVTPLNFATIERLLSEIRTASQTMLKQMLSVNFDITGIGKGNLITLIYFMGNKEQRKELLPLIEQLSKLLPSTALLIPFTNKFYGYTLSMLIAQEPSLFDESLKLLVEKNIPLSNPLWKDPNGWSLLGHIAKSGNSAEKQKQLNNWLFNNIRFRISPGMLLLMLVDSVPCGGTLAGLLVCQSRGVISAPNPINPHLSGIFETKGENDIKFLLNFFNVPFCRGILAQNPTSLLYLLLAKDEYQMTFLMYAVKNGYSEDLPVLLDFLNSEEIKTQLKKFPEHVDALLHAKVGTTEQTFQQLLLEKMHMIGLEHLIPALNGWVDEMSPSAGPTPPVTAACQMQSPP